MTTEITEYSQTAAALADLRHRFKDVVFDVATTKGMEIARKSRAEIVKLRTSLEAKRVEIKAPALERCRLIDAEAKRITAELLALEQPIDALIKAEERRKAEERAERERIERERIASIHARIAKFGEVVASSVGRPSAVIQDAIDSMQGDLLVEPYAEFIGHALKAQADALAKLREMHAAAVAQEAEKARLKAEREELARLRAEQEQRDREEKERIEADRKRREDEDRQARAKIEAEERAARERIEAQEREARAKREEADRIAREKIEAEQAGARRRHADEDERLRKERERIDAERREVEARERKSREEAEAKEHAVREAAEAKEREERRQQDEMMDGMQMLESFVERYGKRKEFAAVTKQITAFLAKQKEPA